MSAVERVHLEDGSSVILKSAVEPFTGEASVLSHTRRHGVPVPAVLTSSVFAGQRLAMLLEDLGPQPEEDAPLDVGAQAAVAVHACPPMEQLPRLDTPALAALPSEALDTLGALQHEGRWTDVPDIARALKQLADVAPDRARGAHIPPQGMCHSELHPTSLHTGPKGLRVLDWARAFTGPGLLDLASWEDTPRPLDTDAIGRMIREYIKAGGDENAASNRAGLPAEVWAGGWHRVWISSWYLQQCLRWIPDPANDPATQRTVRRHLAEAVACLT